MLDFAYLAQQVFYTLLALLVLLASAAQGENLGETVVKKTDTFRSEMALAHS